MLALARRLSHLNTLGAALFYSASLHALCRNGTEVESSADELLAIGGEHKLDASRNLAPSGVF